MSEKIMVTGMLVFMLVCLNLKAERKAPVPNQESATISVAPGILLPPSVDTLPDGKITIRTNRNGKKIEARLLDRKIQELMVDGKAVPSSEYTNYEETLNETIASVPPPPPFYNGTPKGPGDLPAPLPGAPNAPLPPKTGYYYYEMGDDQIIMETPKNSPGQKWGFRELPGFRYEWNNDTPMNLAGSIVVDGLDSIDVARFMEPIKLRNFKHFNLKFDSMRFKLDTAQLRRLKIELGQMDHLKMELNDKLAFVLL